MRRGQLGGLAAVGMILLWLVLISGCMQPPKSQASVKSGQTSYQAVFSIVEAVLRFAFEAALDLIRPAPFEGADAEAIVDEPQKEVP